MEFLVKRKKKKKEEMIKFPITEISIPEILCIFKYIVRFTKLFKKKEKTFCNNNFYDSPCNFRLSPKFQRPWTR